MMHEQSATGLRGSESGSGRASEDCPTGSGPPPPTRGRTGQTQNNTRFGNGSFRPETFGRIRAQKADKPAILLPQTVLSHSNPL